MADVGIDLRRSDERSNVRLNPFWMTSAPITLAATNKDALLFSFPAAKGVVFLHEIIFRVETLFAGGTPSITIGYGTLASLTDSAWTVVDATRFMVSTEITEATAGYYPAGAIAIDGDGAVTGSDFAIAKSDGTIGDLILEGADTTIPCIYAAVATGLTSGQGRLLVLASRIDQ